MGENICINNIFYVALKHQNFKKVKVYVYYYITCKARKHYLQPLMLACKNNLLQKVSYDKYKFFYSNMHSLMKFEMNYTLFFLYLTHLFSS